MNYKNNYQRKQAVWREKWLKKEEKRLMQRDWKRLKKDVAKFATTVQEACQLIHNEIVEIVKSAGELTYQIYTDLVNEEEEKD
jgi:hypothetical protein